jgi:hypothetical protein
MQAEGESERTHEVKVREQAVHTDGIAALLRT